MPLNHTNRIMKWDDIDDSALVQLVYVSTLTLGSRLSTSIFDEVEGHARNYNQQNNITGTLCYGNGHFLQCIEGKKSDVFNLQERIFVDSRHKNVEVLLLQVINHRSFADWRMRLLFLERWLWSPRPRNRPYNYLRFYHLRRTAGRLIGLSSFCKLSKLSIVHPILRRQVLLIMHWVIWCVISRHRIRRF
ncbi:BLUF domain-containing protein [Psychrobacter sp. ER1]|uniref:BLUF domain-containing protein n=1 Tax=Psychrobacter sp. ER1 TaxID=3406645 RepID=UPI003B42EB41